MFPFAGRRLNRYADTVYLRDRTGVQLRTSLGTDQLKCEPVPLDKITPWAGMALIAAEDKRFFSHHGVDPIAILRALFQNASSGWVVSGASTISTQIIRMTNPRSRNISTKGIEAFRALQMERKFDKSQILAQYLNRAPFGSNIMGIQAASRFYFCKNAADLSLGEASLLMGLPQSPSRFRPDRHLTRALKRRDFVLGRMLDLNMITSAQQRSALAQPLAIASHPEAFSAPHFCDLVTTSLSLAPGVFTTTIDPALQLMAEEELSRQSRALHPHGVRGGAVVVIEVSTGAVRALVGSPDYFGAVDGQVNGAVALRSPGSTLKPFVYAQAFDNGVYIPSTVVGDVPIQFKEYLPRNSDREYRGLVSLREALVESLNIPAIGCVQRIGLKSFVRLLRDLGIRGIDHPSAHYGVSLVLGTAEVRLIDLANAYACLARGGEWKPFCMLESDQKPRGVRIFSEAAAWFIADILGGDERSLAFTGHFADVRLPRVAWKTGTSNGYRDAWTLAYNPDYVVGVWIGNPDGEGTPVLTGINAAAPLVSRIFRRMYPDGNGPWYVRPANIRSAAICRLSGCPVGPHCPEGNTGWVISGVTSMAPCNVHRNLPHDRQTGRRLAMSELDGRNVDWRVAEIWPRPVAAFLNAQREITIPSGSSPPAPTADSPRADTPSSAMAGNVPLILSPMNGSTIRQLVPPGEKTASPIALKARCANPEETLYWYANQKFLGSTTACDTFFWASERGTHHIRCATASGGVDVAKVVVE